MHGTGLRLASHTVGRGGEETFEGGCEKAVLFAKAEKESFQPAEHALGPVRTLFGPSVLGRVRYVMYLHASTVPPRTSCPYLSSASSYTYSDPFP